MNYINHRVSTILNQVCPFRCLFRTKKLCFSFDFTCTSVEYSMEVLTAGRLTRHVRHVHTLVETSVLRVQNKSPFITIVKCNKTLSCLY